MKTKLMILIELTLLIVEVAVAQGGKAEPLRISFRKAKPRLLNPAASKPGQVYEFIYGAKAGQKVKVKILTSTPKEKFHYFSLLDDGFDFASETDINYEYNFTAPKTGDYLLYINFNPTSKVKSGRFSLNITITGKTLVSFLNPVHLMSFL